MLSKKFFADIHCHPTLNPFARKLVNKRKLSNIWDTRPLRKREISDRFPSYSQSDVTTLAKGNVKIVIAALSPIEQGWFKPRVFGKRFFTDITASCLTNLPISFINRIQSSSCNYYDLLKKEFLFLEESEKKYYNVDGKNFKYEIVSEKSSFEKYFNEDDTILIIPSIEGCHSFINGNENYINDGKFSLKALIDNILEIKNSLKYKPFYVTLSHHFYNGIAGHCRSIPLPGNIFLQQEIGKDLPLNSKGIEVIHCLLSIGKYKNYGRRILIDVKHLSISSRRDVYKIISDYNSFCSQNEKIPIIFSHAAWSGFSSFSDCLYIPDTDYKYKNNKPFNTWSINLTGDDLIEIFKSNGLIGITLDERILAADSVIEEYRYKIKNKIIINEEQKQDFWGQIILENILQMVKYLSNNVEISGLEKSKIWDLFAIGSDFDGIINPVDPFPTAFFLKDLHRTIVRLLKNNILFEKLSFNYTAEEIADKICFKNALGFLRKHLN